MFVNPRLQKNEIDAKLDEWARINESGHIHDAFEDPAKSLEYYKEQLKFWDDKKRLLARISEKSLICEEERVAYNDLMKCLITIYPPIEMKYLQMVNILENQTQDNNS